MNATTTYFKEYRIVTLSFHLKVLKEIYQDVIDNYVHSTGKNKLSDKDKLEKIIKSIESCLYILYIKLNRKKNKSKNLKTKKK